jgi:hypothetical protein
LAPPWLGLRSRDVQRWCRGHVLRGTMQREVECGLSGEADTGWVWWGYVV